MLLVPLAIALGPLGPAASPAAGEGDEVIRARYDLDLVARSRATFALPPGRRTIRSFRWVPEPGSTVAWKAARLRLVWDDDDPSVAAVDAPLGRFVTPEEGSGPGPRAFVNRRPMPYRQSGRIVIDAEGPVRGSFRIVAEAGGTDLDDRGYLHAGIGAGDGGPARSVATPSGGLPSDVSSAAGSPLRFWYDRHPGPAPAGGRE